MTRLIDADALHKEIGKALSKNGWMPLDRTILANLLANAPTVQREGWVSDEAIESAMGSIGMSDNRPLGQQVDSVKTLVRLFAAPTDKE